MTPGDESDAVRIDTGLLTESSCLGGAFDHWLANDFNRDRRRGIEGRRNLLRIGRDFFKGFGAVKMLAAGHKPDL